MKSNNTTTSILIGFDGSESAVAAVRSLWCAGLPKRGQATVVTAVFGDGVPLAAAGSGATSPSDFSWVTPQIWDEFHRSALVQARQRNDDGVALARQVFPEWEITGVVSEKTPNAAILDEAQERNASMIVVGSHNRSALARLALGSTSQFVLNHGDRSVWIGRGPVTGPDSPVRLIVAADGSKGSRAAIDEVARRIWPYGSTAHVLTVVDAGLSAVMAGTAAGNWAVSQMPDLPPDPINPDDIAGAAAKPLILAGLVTTSTVVVGDAKRVILDTAERWGADLIVCGTAGHSRRTRLLLGSVSASIAARATCSVQVIRAAQGSQHNSPRSTATTNPVRSS